eukprot:8050786-Alexandrium_andersonii.AAC.2
MMRIASEPSSQAWWANPFAKPEGLGRTRNCPPGMAWRPRTCERKPKACEALESNQQNLRNWLAI